MKECKEFVYLSNRRGNRIVSVPFFGELSMRYCHWLWFTVRPFCRLGKYVTSTFNEKRTPALLCERK